MANGKPRRHSKKGLKERATTKIKSFYHTGHSGRVRRENTYLARREQTADELRRYINSIERLPPYQRENQDLKLYRIEKAYLDTLDSNREQYEQGELPLWQLQDIDNRAKIHYETAMKRLGKKSKRLSKLERKIMKKKLSHRLEEIAAVVLILIGASIVLSTNATVTTYATVPENASQAQFFIIGIILIALGIFFPSMAFLNRFRKESKKKNSRVNKKNKKKKK